MPRRRKKRSAEVRNSLRLFGLLAVLAGVNVYVFFFNHGTAPREVLKPSSMVSAAEAKQETLRQATAEARAAVTPGADIPLPATAAGSRSKPPVALAPARPPGPGGGSPKAAPGGSPGQAATVVGAGAAAGNTSDGNPASSQDSSSNSSPDGSREGKFGPSDTLGQVLAREGFEGEAGNVVAALSRLSDPKLIRGGQSYVVRLDEEGEPEAFEYRPTAATRFVVARKEGGGGWTASRVDQPIEIKVVQAAGAIDSSLYESVQKAGEGNALAGLLVELLAWDVNFYTDTHPGDTWKVVIEKQYLGGRFYRYGHILAAEYGGKVGTFRAFYWKSGGRGAGNQERNDGRNDGRYYDEKGRAISKTLLKTPLRYVRISSKFDRHRFHPILHQERAHLGIDYAAPVGTPVWASAGGKVVECEMKRGSGNTVVIAHANGLGTRYYHLQRFARGLRAGQAVRQKEVIGYVGTTGLSTGPHLHFSVTKGGAFVDPSKVQVDRDAPVPERAAFLDAIRPRMATLRAMQPAALARN